MTNIKRGKLKTDQSKQQAKCSVSTIIIDKNKMKKFIVIYHTPNDAQMEASNTSPEQQAEGMKLWMDWAKNCGDKLIDMGSPLTNGQSLTPSGSSASKKEVVGYSILQAKDMEEAKSLLKGHPHLGWNGACSIEVHETREIPGM